MCFNCLLPGHFRPQCPSDQNCQKSHHSLLHALFDRYIEAKETDRTGRSQTLSLSTEANNSSMHRNSRLSHPDHNRQRNALLMTFQIGVTISDGHMTKGVGLVILRIVHILCHRMLSTGATATSLASAYTSHWHQWH